MTRHRRRSILADRRFRVCKKLDARLVWASRFGYQQEAMPSCNGFEVALQAWDYALLQFFSISVHRWWVECLGNVIWVLFDWLDFSFRAGSLWQIFRIRLAKNWSVYFNSKILGYGDTIRIFVHPSTYYLKSCIYNIRYTLLINNFESLIMQLTSLITIVIFINVIDQSLSWFLLNAFSSDCNVLYFNTINKILAP